MRLKGLCTHLLVLAYVAFIRSQQLSDSSLHLLSLNASARAYIVQVALNER